MEHNHYSTNPNEIILPEETVLSDDNTEIQEITTAMQTTLNKSMENKSPKLEHKRVVYVNPNYIYARCSARTKHELLQVNTCYQAHNRKPPKKIVDLYMIINNTATFTIKDTQVTIPIKENRPIIHPKDARGQEESVNNHTYNDYLPIALSVKDFKELYTPKTIQYMWTGNNLDYDVAMALKKNMNIYLSLKTTEQALYMSTISEVRNVTEDDFKDDACDSELLGHRGVFAKKDIPAMSIIGVYTGIFIADALDMLTLSEKMPIQHLQDYLFRIPLNDKFPKITGYQYGNRLSLINAASNYKGDDETIFEQLCRRSNIMLVAGKSNECPIPKIANNENCPDVLFFIAGCDIPKGTQLLYDYGNVYW